MSFARSLNGYGLDGLRRYHKSSGDGGSGEQRRQEDARQARVANETDIINSIFAGAPARKHGVDQILDWGDAVNTNAETGGVVYDKNGNLISSGATGGGPGPSAISTSDPLYAAFNGGGGVYHTAIDLPESTGFNDDYFNSIADKFSKFQTPILDTQIETARRELPYKYASTDSAEYQRAAAELERDAAQQRAQVASQGQDFANTQRSQVENERSNLLNMAIGGADANTLAQSANSHAAALAKPPSFSPIADAFQKYTQAGSYNPAFLGAAPGQPLYFGRPPNSNLYPSGSGSVRTVI